MTNIASRLRTEEHSDEWFKERLDYMNEFITEERKEVLQRTVSQRTHYMRIMTENMFHPQNASAIMRHCEAFGIQQIHTVEDRCKFDPSVNIVRGTQKWVDVEHHENTAEAVEVALKLAKRYTGRTELISMRRAYHGSTHGAMSMMGTPEGEEWKAEFRPLLPDVKSINFNSFEDLAQITERTAGVLCEVVQGEAGVRLPNPEWLKALRKKCNDTGAMLIFDEIQTGMGRTGAMFASAKYCIEPDIVCLAKAFGGGMPLGGVASNKQILDSFTHNPCLGHITTFGGHPVCCAAGLAALNYMIDNNIVEQVERKGALYEELLKDHPAVLEIRRSGLLLAVELGSEERLFKVMELFKEEGIMSDWFLYCATAFRISPPLVISDEEIRESVEIIRRVLDKL